MMGMLVRPIVGNAPRGCHKKIKYAGQLDAADGLLRLLDYIRHGSVVGHSTATSPLGIYECEWCGCWHIGHAPKAP